MSSTLPARVTANVASRSLVKPESRPLPTRLPPLPSISDLLKIYGVKAKRNLSQNFLINPRLCNKFVGAAAGRMGLKDCTVIEVGPGPGNLTRAILAYNPRDLIVIEKDRRFLPTLEMLCEAVPEKMKITLGDILRLNIEPLLPMDQKRDWEDYPPPVKIIGNLPFNIASPLLIKWLQQISERKGPFALGRVPLTLSFQKEVAERIVAPPFWDERSRLSVMTQIYCKAWIPMKISGKSFTPPPEVDVAVVNLIPRRKPAIDLPFKLIEKVVRVLFNAKRKNLMFALRHLFPPEEDFLVEELLTITKMDITMKPILLSLEDIGRICYAYRHLCESHPAVLEYDFRQPQSKNLLITPSDPNIKHLEDSKTKCIEDKCE